MPQVEAPFIIAVIREKEKTLLSDNEITRIMHEMSLLDAREVLMDTPYALFLTEDVSIPHGLTKALEAEFLWLAEHLDDKNVLAFIAARYDVLHLAQAIIALNAGEPHVPEMSRIGTLSHELLQEMVFTQGYVPTKETRFWVEAVRVQKEAITNNTWSMPFLFESMQHVLEDRLQELASTPFMKQLAAQVKSRHESDSALRGDAGVTDAVAYEWDWDAKAIRLAASLRFEPIGYDPIIAYWITKEMEVKTITLVFAALAGGFSPEEVTRLIRPFAHV